MSLSKETEEKLQQLQLFEQNLQTFIMQKQTLQMGLAEVESAIGELEKTKKAFRIIGNIMVDADKEELKQELTSRKETSELRIKTIEKQEKMIRERAQKLQNEVLGDIKKD